MGGCVGRAVNIDELPYGIKVGEPEHHNQSAIFRHKYSAQTNLLFER